MRPDDLLAMVKATPFKPFRIRMNGGRTFDIRHPEMVRVGRSSAYIFIYTPNADPEEEAFERAHIVSLLLMEAFEPLDAKQSA